MKLKFGMQGRGYRSLVLAAVVGTSIAATCVGCDRSDSSAPTLVLDSLPAGVRERSAEFGGKVRMLGYAMTGRQKSLRAGRNVSVTLYWQANAKVEPGYKLSTQLLDAAGERVLDLDNAGPLREQKDGKPLLPPENWVPGKVYVDELSFTVPKQVKTWQVQLAGGLVKGNEKMKITNGVDVDSGLALFATSATGVSGRGPAQRRVPDLRVNVLDAKTKIKIDGKLDEEAWKEAPSAPLGDVITGQRNKKSPVDGTVRLLWNDQGFYVAFEAQDTDLVGGFQKTDKDPHLWAKDTVVIMVDPDGDGDNKDYYEIQINPQNLVYDTLYDDYDSPRQGPDGPFGHQEWSSGVKSAVVLDGTLDKSDDTDKGYVVEAFLPWKSFSKAKKIPPALGDTWRMNFYVMQNVNAVSWSPLLRPGDFQRASRFGKVLFASKAWVEPSAAPAPSAAAGAPPAPNGSGAAVNAPVPAGSVVPAKAPLVERVQAAKPPAPAVPAPTPPSNP